MSFGVRLKGHWRRPSYKWSGDMLDVDLDGLTK